MKTIKTIITFILAVTTLFFFDPAPLQAARDCHYTVSSLVAPLETRLSARMYYPCNIDELSEVGATTLTNGMGGTKEGMYWLAEPIAEAGMIVVTVSALDNMTVLGYETAHKSGIEILKAENSNPTSPIYGKIGKYGIMGYSKGGGGSINASSDLGNEVDTCIGLAPWGATPTRNLSAATMILTGTVDMIAPAYMGKTAFEILPSDIPQLYASLRGKAHLFWNMNVNPGNADDLIIAWLKYHLEGDASYKSIIQNPGYEFTDYEYYEGSGSNGGPDGCNSSGLGF